MLAWSDYLPDLKGALTSFYDEKIKPTIDNKSSEFKDLLQENLARGANTHRIVAAVALAIFLLLTLAFFWQDPEHAIQWKYLLCGLLVSHVGLYVIELRPWEFSPQLISP